MKVHCFVMAYNESETIHLTIKHYQQFCDKIFLYDNFSDDNTREIAESMGCEVKLFGIKGVLDDREYTKLKNNCWKGSDADWVIVVDADEIIAPSDLVHDTFGGMRYVLSRSVGDFLQARGWQVISEDIPKNSWSEITDGFEYEPYSKIVCFNPKRVKEINYVHGCHIASPKTKYPGGYSMTRNAFTLFHYRNVGGAERLVKRHAMYRERMSDWNIRWKAGGHYLYEDSQRRKEWQEQFEKSRPYLLHGIVSYSPDTQNQKTD